MTAITKQLAVVTGATSGIGRAIAEELWQRGAAVSLIGRRGEVLREMTETMPLTRAHRADLTDDDDVARLAGVLAGEPPIDILVHCAAVLKLGKLHDAPVADLDWHYRTNLRAPYQLTRALLPLLSSQAQIVFLNSSAGLVARAGVAQYAATKHALKAVADSLRDELHPSGRRVLSVFAGRTATPLQAAMNAMEKRPYEPARYMDPHEVARLIVDALQTRSVEVKELNLRPRFE